jgi:hypothetical protein
MGPISKNTTQKLQELLAFLPFLYFITSLVRLEKEMFHPKKCVFVCVCVCVCKSSNITHKIPYNLAVSYINLLIECFYIK